MNEIIEYKKTENLISDLEKIIENGRKYAFKSADTIQIYTNWNIGRRIVEEEQDGKARAKYGTKLIKTLAEKLSEKYGTSYSKRNLEYYRKFYLCFSDIQIVNSCVHNLTKIKCFVLFEIKTHTLCHEDVGQLDMYVRMYDDFIKEKDDNPTLGVLLCTDTDSTIAKYSVLNDSDQLFASKYMTYMPSQDELQAEIERQRQFFIESHSR